MELFKTIRLKIGNTILSKKIERTRRRVFYSSISQVKTIGIVWDASRIQDFSSLLRFYQQMHDRNIDVKIIGLYQGKELPEQYTSIRFLTCIKKNELNVFYIPDSAEAEYFIKNRFDVLIDINFEKNFSLHFITKLSMSGFKVGLFESDSGASTFDLMIELKKTVPVENYLNEVIRYLEMINSGSAEMTNKS